MPLGQPGLQPGDVAPIAPLGGGAAGGVGTDSDYTAESDFDKELVATAAELLNIFGETVVYYPSGRLQRTILAIVTRQDNEKLPDLPHGRGPNITIAVANNSTIGIASSEIDTGLDQIELAVRIGQVKQNRPFARIIAQDAGFLKLEVR